MGARLVHDLVTPSFLQSFERGDHLFAVSIAARPQPQLPPPLRSRWPMTARPPSSPARSAGRSTRSRAGRSRPSGGKSPWSASTGRCCSTATSCASCTTTSNRTSGSWSGSMTESEAAVPARKRNDPAGSPLGLRLLPCGWCQIPRTFPSGPLPTVSRRPKSWQSPTFVAWLRQIAVPT